MRKNLLALSIAAMVGGLSGVANAQAVVTDTVGARVISNNAAFGGLKSPADLRADSIAANQANPYPAAAQNLTIASTGIGHVLVVPYFTTQGTNATLLNLVNTDQKNGKAVKLRFRGASNSDDLFDITVFLSPGDVWAANVSANGELSALTTNDTSCTLPSAAQIKETFGNFSTNRVLNNAAAETREGYIEILNMADIPPAAGADKLFTAIKHVAGKAPCTQAVMDLQANPLSAADPANTPVARGYSWPTGGLMANWTVVNVGTKATFTGEAVALRATPSNTINEAGAANLVFSPQTTARVDNAAALTADPLLKQGRVRAASYDFPDLSTPYTTGVLVGTPEGQATELADALATFSVTNEYLTNPTVNFATDWVFSMPTRRYAVALDYENKVVLANAGVATHFRMGVDGNVSLNKDKTRICVDAGQLVAFDHEEQSRTSFVISPDDILKFCGETSVLTFNGKPSVLGASLAVNNIATTFTDGWLQIQTPGVKTAGNYNGLPVVGYAASKAVGPDAGNFGGTWMHRGNRFSNQPF